MAMDNEVYKRVNPINNFEIAFRIARIANWMLSDNGYTKKKAAFELAELAKEIDPTIRNDILGKAAHIEFKPRLLDRMR